MQNAKAAGTAASADEVEDEEMSFRLLLVRISPNNKICNVQCTTWLLVKSGVVCGIMSYAPPITTVGRTD